MLYNLVVNEQLKQSYVIPATEGGVNDLAFENGWRIKFYNKKGVESMNYLKDKDHNVIAYGAMVTFSNVKFYENYALPYLSADEWNDLVNTMYSDEDTLLLCDNPNYSPYVEDVADEPEDEYAEWTMLDEPETNDADTECEVPHDFVTEFHYLNKQ